MLAEIAAELAIIEATLAEFAPELADSDSPRIGGDRANIGHIRPKSAIFA